MGLVVSPQVQDFASLFWASWGQSLSPACWGPSDCQHNHMVTSPSSFVSPSDTQRVHSAPSSRSLMTTLTQDRTQYWPLAFSTSRWPPTWLCAALWAWPFSWFCNHLVAYLTHTSAALLWSYGGQCQGAYWNPGRQCPLLFPHPSCWLFHCNIANPMQSFQFMCIWVYHISVLRYFVNI